VVTKRQIRVQKIVRPSRREPTPPSLDPGDPEIVRAKEHLYAAGRARRAA